MPLDPLTLVPPVGDLSPCVGEFQAPPPVSFLLCVRVNTVNRGVNKNYGE